MINESSTPVPLETTLGLCCDGSRVKKHFSNGGMTPFLSVLMHKSSTSFLNGRLVLKVHVLPDHRASNGSALELTKKENNRTSLLEE